MIAVRYAVGCLILLASLPFASGLCSTCLEKRCYDNGECIIGCVPGYLGEFCDEACPSGCLNKACHLDLNDGSVTCTDGCKPGYCRIKCDLPCPRDCATCDRQCDSCNVTHCPERRYGADCSEICNPKYGKCARETGQCMICRRGNFGNSCTRKCTACFTRADTIRDTCLSGCDMCQSKETCPAGFHGDACEVRCSPGCDKPERGCNKATGECFAGCVSGFHGLTCNYTCSEHCLSGKCNQTTGECFAGCVSGYHGLTCNYMCSRFCVGGICNQHDGVCTSGCISGYKANFNVCELLGSNKAVAIAVPIILVCLFAVVVIAAVIWRRRRYRRSTKLRTKPVEDETDRTELKEPIPGPSNTVDPPRDPETVQLMTDEADQTEAPDTDVYMKLIPGPPVTADASRVSRGQENAAQQLPDEIQHLNTRTKDEIESITAGMIRVSAVDIVLKKLKAGQRWITITGNAGDGKTVLGYLVLKEFLKKNVNVFTVDKPEEYDLIARMNKEKVIMFDDRFGAFLADQQLIKSWIDVIRKLLSFNEHDETKSSVIFISRKNVVNESRMYLGKFTDQMFDPKCVVDLSLRKVTEERLNILEYHLHHENVTVNHELQKKVAVKDIAHGYPHCCKMYSKLRSNGFDVDIEEFFESPLKFLDMTTQVLYKGNCKDLFQLLVKNDGKFNVYTVTDEDKRQELLQVEKEQKGSYITVWKDGICRFAHPSVYESVLNVINDIDPLYCVQYATLSVIRQKMIISTSDEEDSSRAPCYIIVKPIPDVMKALAERVTQEEILKGDYSVFEHRLCKSRQFSEALVSCVTSHEEESGSKQLINQPGKKGDTMMLTAVKRGRMVAVQSLVKAGADVDIPDERGNTTLHYLCQFFNSREDTIQLIITEGRGDVNKPDQYGQTPLHCLCQVRTSADGQDDRKLQRVLSCVKFIITEGRGDVNTSDKYGQTPLHYLFKYQVLSSEEIKWIITDAKGDLNRCEQHKSTPLHYLCAYSGLQPDAVDLMINEGKANFNTGDEHGTTPFHYLSGNDNVELDVVLQIVNTARGDLNKQDNTGITPLHVLCKGSLQVKDVLTLINKGDKADNYGNTPLHFLCRRRGISDEEIQQLKQLPESNMKKQNKLGYTPLDYLNDQDGSLPGSDGMIVRSAADLVLCRVKHGNTSTLVLGRAMILNSERVNSRLQVEGRELNNMARSRDRETPNQFKEFEGTCSSPLPLPPSPSPISSPSYWETQCQLGWRKRGYTLLEMGVKEGRRDIDKEWCVSLLLGSVCVSVVDKCHRHTDRLCIKVWRNDQGWWMIHQVGECLTLPLPTPGELTFTFGLVLDVGRGRVGIVDVERGKLLCKIDQVFTQEVFPMFYVNPDNYRCAARMRLVSGREISVTDSKIKLIQQALSD